MNEASLNKQGVIFGPWVGEFGWELFAWQAYCRSLSRRYDFCVVISRPGNSYLYSDFCNIYVPFAPDSSGIVDSHTNTAVTNFNAQEFLTATVSLDVLRSYTWDWIGPTKIGNPPYDHWRAPVSIQSVGEIIPEYRVYQGDSQGQRADILIHARNRKIREIDNWNQQKWNDTARVLKSNFTVACIGEENSSLLIEGATDYRGMELEFVTGLMRSAKCIVGPSSGPLHLAALSGCPQVWWTSNPRQNFARYKNTWNPFCVKSHMVDGFDPEPADVISAIRTL